MLQKYAGWVESLQAGELAEWERYLSTLAPGDGLKPALEAFRFDSERDGAKDAERWSRTGCDLLLSGLAPDDTD